MKKLLITMMSAAALVGVTKAAEFEGATNFDGLTAGTALDITKGDDGQDTSTKYWSVANSTGTGLVEGGVSFGTISNVTELAGVDTYPSDISTDNNKALKVDAEARLTRNMVVADGSAQTVAFATGGGIYFDSLVQFTASDNDDAPSTDGDKLVVWLYDNPDDEDEPVLKIKAAASVDDSGAVTVPETSFTTQINVQPETWYRLKIESFVGTAGVPYFKVYVNGDLAQSGDQTEFYSMVSAGKEGSGTLQSVSFEGMGALDNLSFGSIDAAESFNLETSINFDNEITVENLLNINTTPDSCTEVLAQYAIGDSQTFNDLMVSASIPLPAEKVTVRVGVATDYQVKGTGWNKGDAIEGGFYYWKEYDTSAQANGTTLTVEVDLEAENGGGTPPVEPKPTDPVTPENEATFPEYVTKNGANADGSDADRTNAYKTWLNGPAKDSALTVEGATTTLAEAAFLLNVAPTTEDVEEAKKALLPIIKFVDGEVVVDDPSGQYNGTIEVKGAAKLGDEFDLLKTDATARFFKTFLK